MPMLDVFRDDAFSTVTLTDAVEKIPFVPGYLGSLGIFEPKRVATTTVAIEQKQNVLTFLNPIPRGAPGQTIDKVKRTVRDLRLVHHEIADAIYADEVQDVRPFGQESGLQTVAQMVAERIRDVHLPAHAATEELARLGAVKGIITYADGSTLNLFNEFGVTQEEEIDFDLDNNSPASGALRNKCQSTIRAVANQLGGLGFKYLHALCGDAFFDGLIAHPEVVASYTATDQASELRRSYVEGSGLSFGEFWFGGIRWCNYRGVGPDDQPMVGTDACHIFPVGVPNLFRSIWGPGDWNDTVNTMGRRLYVKQMLMPNEKGVNIYSQMNALHICTRPKVLLKGKRT